MGLPHPSSNSRPSLRVYNPDTPFDAQAASAGLSSRMTLTKFFEQWFSPVALAHSAPRNVEQYEESIAYWAAFTGDPQLWQIDDLVTAKFLRGLRLLKTRGGEPLSDNTVRKHIVAVQAVLDRAGAGSRKKPGKGLLESPLIEKPSIVFNEDVRNFLLTELSAILAACHTATTPHLPGVRDCDFWRGLWLFDYNVGCRLGTLLKLEWSWIGDGDLGATKKWLRVPASALKGKRGQRFYLNQGALAALAMVGSSKCPTGRIFPWPFEPSWLHACRRRIMAAAGIVRKGWGMHSVRKACGTELGKLSDIAGKMQLGHAGDVTIQHYQSRVILCDALDRLPQPEFDRDRDGPQLRLF